MRKERIRNDDQVAKGTFLEVLNSAKRTLIVRDDGDDPSSLYFDDDVAEQVRARLRNNPRQVVSNTEMSICVASVRFELYAHAGGSAGLGDRRQGPQGHPPATASVASATSPNASQPSPAPA